MRTTRWCTCAGYCIFDIWWCVARIMIAIRIGCDNDTLRRRCCYLCNNTISTINVIVMLCIVMSCCSVLMGMVNAHLYTRHDVCSVFHSPSSSSWAVIRNIWDVTRLTISFRTWFCVSAFFRCVSLPRPTCSNAMYNCSRRLCNLCKCNYDGLEHDNRNACETISFVFKSAIG